MLMIDIFQRNLSIKGLIKKYRLKENKIAIELNGTILPKDHYKNKKVNDEIFELCRETDICRKMNFFFLRNLIFFSRLEKTQ